MDLKILQINLNRCSAAQDLMEQSALDLEADMVLISEPYRCRDGWFRDIKNDAAIWVTPKWYKRGHPLKLLGSGEGSVILRAGNMAVVSCYYSPSISVETFEARLDELEARLGRTDTSDMIVAGDLNAKSPVWGSRRWDSRGSTVLGFCGRMGLIPLRSEGRFSFERNNKTSLIDIIMCSRGLTRSLVSSKILDDYTGSDHRYLMHVFRDAHQSRGKSDIRTLGNTRGEIDFTLFRREYRLWMRDTAPLRKGNDEAEMEYYQGLVDLAEACSWVGRKPRKEGNKKWWWTEDIKALRAEARKCRRRLQRAFTTGKVDRIASLHSAYKEAKRSLNKEVKASKKERWLNLVNRLDEDIWGRPYKVVIESLTQKAPPEILDKEEMRGVVESLFATTPTTERDLRDPWCNFEGTRDEVSEEEVLRAISRLKKKAAGPDGVSVDLISWLGKHALQDVCIFINKCFLKRKFLTQWKIGRLVLIPKAGKEKPRAWRPICILSNWAKIMEYIVKDRVLSKIEHADNQFGFRKQRSTVDAMMAITSSWDRARAGGKHCLLVTLDVKNAFNSLRWNSIRRAVLKSKIQGNLRGIIFDYLQDRNITYRAEGEDVVQRVYGGVPQGSVLGPLLWNMVYDDLLRIKLPTGSQMVGYADDLALVLVSRNLEDLQLQLQRTMDITVDWYRKENLELAKDKTEVLLLTGRKVKGVLPMQICDRVLTTKGPVKYLGVIFEGNQMFKAHTSAVTEKALKRIGALSRIMPNQMGGGYEARVLLYKTIESIVMYGAPAWASAMRHEGNRKIIRAAQRAALCRVVRAYRSTSLYALTTLAGCIPWCLLLEERSKIHGKIRNKPDEADPREFKSQTRKEERRATMEKWQSEWDAAGSARWTHKIINRIEDWIPWGPKILNFRLTQILTGHGCFAAFKKKIGRSNSEDCWLCAEKKDDAEHTLLRCPFFKRERERVINEVGALEVDTLLGILADEKKREYLMVFINKTMGIKEEMERQLDAEQKLQAGSARNRTTRE